MNWRMIAGIAIPAALVAATVTLVRPIDRSDAVPVVEVTRGPFVRTVQAEGNLKAAEATQITAPSALQDATKIAWLAPDGGAVRKGDVVVRFDPTDMEKDLQEGRTAFATAETRIAGKKAEADGTSSNLDRDAELASSELEYARQFQNTDQLLFSRNQIIESEIDERLATTRKEHADAVRKIRERLSKADLDLLDVERRMANLRIKEAQTGLSSLDVTAPHDGILVLKKDWRGNVVRVGDVVWSGQSIAEIPVIDEMEAEVFVLEADAGNLAVGLNAILTVEAHPGKTYRAVAKKVDKLARPRLRGVPVQYFAVTLRLDRTDTKLMKPGQRVLATIVIEKRSDCLAIPRAALFADKSGETIAYRRNGRKFDQVAVKVGSVALGRVVVESGLVEGDVIALRDPTRPLTEEPRPADTDGGVSAGSGVKGL